MIPSTTALRSLVLALYLGMHTGTALADPVPTGKTGRSRERTSSGPNLLKDLAFQPGAASSDEVAVLSAPDIVPTGLYFRSRRGPLRHDLMGYGTTVTTAEPWLRLPEEFVMGFYALLNIDDLGRIDCDSIPFAPNLTIPCISADGSNITIELTPEEYINRMPSDQSDTPDTCWTYVVPADWKAIHGAKSISVGSTFVENYNRMLNKGQARS